MCTCAYTYAFVTAALTKAPNEPSKVCAMIGLRPWCRRVRARAHTCTFNLCAPVHLCAFASWLKSLLFVNSPWVYDTGGSFMCPRLGEGLSGRAAWSQGSHTAAHCPALRAASQRQGGLAPLPLLLGSVSGPGGGSPKWPPRESQALCPIWWCSCMESRGEEALKPCRWKGSVDSYTEWCHSKEGCVRKSVITKEMLQSLYILYWRTMQELRHILFCFLCNSQNFWKWILWKITIYFIL